MYKGLKVFMLSAMLISGMASWCFSVDEVGKAETQRLDLVKEAYWKMDKFYYKKIEVSNVGNLFYRCHFMMMSLLGDLAPEKETNMDRLTYSTINMIVDALKDPSDKYSKFIYKDYLERVIRENLTSKFGGIGIEVERVDTAFFIAKVYDASSAFEQGVLKGDQVLAVNDHSVEGLKLDELEKLLRIDDGASVKMTLMHAQESVRYDVVLVSRTIWVPSVTSEYSKEKKIGYIAVSRFLNKTSEEFKQAIETVRKEELQGLIVDMRGNSGGDETQAIALCSFFVPKDSLIVYFMKRDVGRREERTEGEPLGLSVPMVILTDNKTASSAEIFSGVMRFYQKATIVGTTTNGLGSLKNTVGLSDGSALFLITSRTYLPNGETYDQVGIQPDIVVDGNEAQMNKAEEVILQRK